MAKFRKKPVIIDAVPAATILANAQRNWNALPDWIKAAYEGGDIVLCPDELYISTTEGIMVAQKTDWVIRGIKGEIYPCKPDIFDATHEAI